MTLEILFIGLQETGASLAMALAEAKVDAECIGYDRDKQAARASQESGAVGRLVINPYKAARTADVILLTGSPAEADKFLDDVVGNLKPGAAIIDCSPLRASRFRWATDELGERAHYLAAIPVTGVDALYDLKTDYTNARSDLFHNSQLALVIPVSTPEQIVNITVNLAQAIGSEPFFLDQAEVEAVTTLLDTLPALLGACLLRMAAAARGWPDIQRIAGRPFATTTHHAGEQDSAQLSRQLVDNRQSLIAHVDGLIAELSEFRRLMDEDEADAIEERLEVALAAHETWLAKRRRADWRGDEIARGKISSTGVIGNLFGFDPSRKRGSDRPE